MKRSSRFFMLSAVTFLLVMVCVSGCRLLNDETNTPKRQLPQYNFELGIMPTYGSIKDLSCFDGASDQLLTKVSKWEKEYLNKHSEQVPLTKRVQSAKNWHSSVTGEYDIITDVRSRKLEAILANLVHVVEQHTPALDHPEYKVFLVRHKEGKYINAFTPGGGYLYFTTDLYSFTKNDDERAYILAHEIAHNLFGDCANHTRREEISDRVFGDWSDKVLQVWETAVNPIEKHGELLCDISSAFSCYHASYNPEAGLYIYHRFNELPEDTSATRFLSSHPLNDIRLACLNNYLFRSRVK